jgi:hypothetical protein
MLNKTNTLPLWIYRFLVLAACVLMLTSFLKPWWTGTINAGMSIDIYGWGLKHNLQALASYLAKDVTPPWKIALAWSYMGISISLAILSTFIKKRWSALVLIFIGLGYASYAYVAMNMVIEKRLAIFNIPLQGFATLAQTIGIYGQIEKGYYLAFVTGGVMVALALLRLAMIAFLQRAGSH